MRNPDYWKPGKPYLDELVFNVIPDAASRAVAFERGSVDELRGGDVDIKRLRALPKVEYTTAGWEMFSPQAYLIFNMRKPPFDNLKVREAVIAAINRNMVANNIFFMAVYVRLTRASMLEVYRHGLRQDRARQGRQPQPRDPAHVLRNALLPVITFAGIQLGQMAGGAALTETVFAWPGIGRLMFDALLQRDY